MRELRLGEEWLFFVGKREIKLFHDYCQGLPVTTWVPHGTCPVCEARCPVQFKMMALLRGRAKAAHRAAWRAGAGVRESAFEDRSGCEISTPRG